MGYYTDMTQTTRQSEVQELQKLAPELDAIAVRLARGKPALDLALGEIFLRLSEGDFLIDLAFAKKTDFANEALGLPPRTFFVLMELAAGLRERPLLKKAVLAGAVSPLKARLIMSVAVDQHEAAFTAAALEMTVKQLKELVESVGGEVCDEEIYVLRTLRFS